MTLRLPDPSRADLLAWTGPVEASRHRAPPTQLGPAEAEDAALLAAVPRWHTQWGRFEPYRPRNRYPPRWFAQSQR